MFKSFDLTSFELPFSNKEECDAFKNLLKMLYNEESEGMNNGYYQDKEKSINNETTNNDGSFKTPQDRTPEKSPEKSLEKTLERIPDRIPDKKQESARFKEILYQIALKFDIPEVFKFYNATIEDISRIAQYIEDLSVLGAGKYTQNVPQRSPEFKSATLFKEKAAVIINSQFKNITDILDHKREFLLLHATGLEIILKNEAFQRDSENSILTILMMWIRENRSKREKYLKDLLPLVDMYEMTNYFLINLVPSVYQELEDKELKEIFLGDYNRALEDKNLIQRAQPAPEGVEEPRKRVNRSIFYESSHEKFAMKVEFRKISEWKINEKYYSQPIFSNGFFFYFFMRVETSSSDQTQYLAGYLRCTSEVTSIPNHYLPVTVTFEILLTNNRTRKFPPVSVIFDHFDRSIGSRMNQPNDNWDKIRIGQSDIVKDDKITVIISVDFKNNIN